MEKDIKLVLRGTASFYEQTNRETTQSLENGNLVFLNMPLPVKCNYKCPKCFSGGSDIYQQQLSKRGDFAEFDSDLRKRLITEAKGLGAKTLVIGGAGEPLMFQGLEDILDVTDSNKMHTIIFTNGSLLSKQRAEDYFSRGVSLVFSFDSISPEHYNIVTGTKGNYGEIRKNLEGALELSEKYSSEQNGFKVVPLAVNTNVTLLTYNPKEEIDEIKSIQNLIGDRATHFVSCITPTGNAVINWKRLVGTANFSPNPVLKEAEKIYSRGHGGSSRKKNGQCAYIHNGITAYEGYYMMCPNVGLEVDFGRYPNIPISEYFEAKKRLLQSKGNPLCATKR
ncbi:MAG: radical SAM protein [Nanoarchaeota archaeon]|nr:radical SAM protein [Nanoarchaeota archaeon]